MSFLKLNLCESAQAAVCLFNMFRDGTVNMFLEDGQYKTYGDRSSDGINLGCYDPNRFFKIRLFLTGNCNQVRVYDTKDLGRTRLVEFLVKNPLEGTEGTKVTFSITLSKIDSSECLPKWRMWKGRIIVSEPSKEKEVFNLGIDTWSSGLQLSQQMQKYVGGLIYFES